MIPVLLRIESLGLELQSYALLVVLAVAGALVWIVMNARKRGWSEAEVQRMLRWNWLLSLLAGVVAGWTWQELSSDPHREWLRARSVSSWFIALTGLWTIVALSKRKEIDTRWWLDASVRCFFAVWIVERVGAFVAGQDFGVMSDAPWAITYPLGSEAYIFQSQRLSLSPEERSFAVIPIQLFEAGLAGLGLLLTWRVSALSWGHTMGRSAGILLLWLAATSLCLESYYAESAFKAKSMGSLSPRQLFSVAALLASFWLLGRRGGGLSSHPGAADPKAAPNKVGGSGPKPKKRRKSPKARKKRRR